MKKLIYFLTLLLTLSFIPCVSANVNEVNSYSYLAAESFLEQERYYNPDLWNDLHIVNEDELYDLDGNINGYVYELIDENQEGYIITRKGQGDSYRVIEATFEAPSPYKNNNDDNLYLGYISYFSKSDDNEVVELQTGDSYSISEVEDLFSEEFISDTIQTYSKARAVSTTYLPYVNYTTDFPCINQRIVSNSHCSPTSAANIVRYAYLYKNLEWLDEDNENLSYAELITKMGEEMGTVIGRKGGATYDTDLATGLVSFFKKYTNMEAEVSWWNNHDTITVNQVNFGMLRSYIDKGHPVIATLGSAITGMTSYHSVTVFGYRTDGYAWIADPWNNTSTTIYTGTRKMIQYSSEDKSHVFALYDITLK